jgi:hypothetical protein
MTQNRLILDYLRTGQTLTPSEALRLFGCFRLAARCNDLKRKGYNVICRLIDVGNGKHCGEYKLEA